VTCCQMTVSSAQKHYSAMSLHQSHMHYFNGANCQNTILCRPTTLTNTWHKTSMTADGNFCRSVSCLHMAGGGELQLCLADSFGCMPTRNRAESVRVSTSVLVTMCHKDVQHQPVFHCSANELPNSALYSDVIFEMCTGNIETCLV